MLLKAVVVAGSLSFAQTQGPHAYSISWLREHDVHLPHTRVAAAVIAIALGRDACKQSI